MRTLIVITIITLFSCINSEIVRAQTEKDSTSEKSFLFQVRSNFTLSNFNGATFALQKMVDEKTANRFYFQLNGKYVTGERDIDSESNRFNQGGTDTARYDDFERNSNDDIDINVTVGSIRLKYGSFNDDIRYYGGLGLALNYSYDYKSSTINSEETQLETGSVLNEQTYMREDETSGHLFGIGPVLISGVEYGLTDNLFLLAEYGFQIRYERSFYDSQISSQTYLDGNLLGDGSGNVEHTTNAVIFDSFPVSFGLRVNF